MERLQAWGAQLIAVFGDTLASLVTYLPVVLTAARRAASIGWLLAHPAPRPRAPRAREHGLAVRAPHAALGRALRDAHASHEPRDLDGRVLDRPADLRRQRACGSWAARCSSAGPRTCSRTCRRRSAASSSSSSASRAARSRATSSSKRPSASASARAACSAGSRKPSSSSAASSSASTSSASTSTSSSSSRR